MCCYLVNLPTIPLSIGWRMEGLPGGARQGVHPHLQPGGSHVLRQGSSSRRSFREAVFMKVNSEDSYLEEFDNRNVQKSG